MRLHTRFVLALCAAVVCLPALPAQDAPKPPDNSITLCVTISEYRLTGYGRSHIPPDRLRDVVVKRLDNPKKGVKVTGIRNEQSGEEAVTEARSKGCNYLLTMAVGTPGKYRLVALEAEEPVIQGDILITNQNSANDISIPSERAAGDALSKLQKRRK